MTSSALHLLHAHSDTDISLSLSRFARSKVNQIEKCIKCNLTNLLDDVQVIPRHRKHKHVDITHHLIDEVAIRTIFFSHDGDVQTYGMF